VYGNQITINSPPCFVNFPCPLAQSAVKHLGRLFLISKHFFLILKYLPQVNIPTRLVVEIFLFNLETEWEVFRDFSVPL
jgi:hypothetical protein